MKVAPILTAGDAKRIAAIAARLQSDQDGEVLNAGRMLVRGLSKHGLRIGDVLEKALAPQPSRAFARTPRARISSRHAHASPYPKRSPRGKSTSSDPSRSVGS